MNNGAFDDRDNARRHVKLWMQENLPGDYTVNNLRGLARKIVADDLEPVDDIHVQWAETSYGLLRGVVEFAADQLSTESSASGRERTIHEMGLNSHLANARAHAVNAAAALPYRTSDARHSLMQALEQLTEAQVSDTTHSSGVHRARTAISLALMMLGTPSGRSVAA